MFVIYYKIMHVLFSIIYILNKMYYFGVLQFINKIFKNLFVISWNANNKRDNISWIQIQFICIIELKYIQKNLIAYNLFDIFL